MRILFITPYPPSRIRVRSYEILKQLLRSHDVTVLTLCRTEHEVADVETLRNQGHEVVMVHESKQQALLRSGLAIASLRSMHVAFARSPHLAEAVRFLCTERHFDILHIEHLRGIAAVESMIHSYPLVWDAVDCISLLYKQAIKAGPNRSVRAIATLEYRRIQRYEATMLQMLRHVIVTSQRDRQAMVDLQNNQNGYEKGNDSQFKASIYVLPNGVDLEYFHPDKVSLTGDRRRPYNLVFSGKMNYHPNLAAIFKLYLRIMPLIWEQRPEVTLTLAGSDPPKEIQRLANDPRVEVTGYVDDLRVFIGRADVMVCPMIYGTGIQNKVLEAMALGTPVVVTPQVAEALLARSGYDLLVAESAQQFAELTLRLLDDPGLRTTLSHNGRAYIEQHHDWETAGSRLEGIYQHAISTWPERHLSLV